MTDIDLIKQLRGDIERTCDAYKDDVKDDEAAFCINVIKECIQQAANSCIKHLQHKESKETIETAIRQQAGGKQP